MALTPSSTLSPDFSLPSFQLPDVTTGQTVAVDDFAASKVLVVAVLCRHCPYVVHVLPTLIELARQKMPEGAAFLGISANDAKTYPADAPERLADMVRERLIPFPILYDKSQNVARSLQAACTPEFFVFGSNRKLFYHGRMDASTPGNNLPCTGDELAEAIDAALQDAPPPAVQQPSIGCNIKWRS
jgi:peroxiredoxin